MAQTHQKTDLNRASEEDLSRTQQINHEKAQALMHARPFQNWDDVKRVPGFEERIKLGNGGRGGIRTHGSGKATFDFESSALNQTQPPFLFDNARLLTGGQTQLWR